MAALVAAVLETAPVRAGEPHWVCPPGQERFFLGVLGGAPIAGCRLGKASIIEDHVVADYTCAGNQVSIELHPPGVELPAAARTTKFTLVSKNTAPPLLIEGLRERIRHREADFDWVEASKAFPVRGREPDRGTSPRGAGERAPSAARIGWQAGQVAAVAIVIAMTGLGGLLLLFPRRAGETPGHPLRERRPRYSRACSA
jgi:hypothetical protein